MSQLELTQQEHEALRRALESYLGELRTEIVHTDARSVRDDLEEQEKLLKQVFGRLADPRGTSR